MGSVFPHSHALSFDQLRYLSRMFGTRGRDDHCKSLFWSLLSFQTLDRTLFQDSFDEKSYDGHELEKYLHDAYAELRYLYELT